VTYARLERLAAKLHSRGLRPIIDPVLECVLCACSECHAEDSDPLGMWRPLRVVPRGRTLTFLCSACDARVEVRDV
jgi:hypothetical protein